MVEVITRYTGPFRQPTFNVNGGGDELQISVRDNNEEKVIFTGRKFSPEEYEKRGGKKDEERFFDGRIIRKEITPDQITNGVVYIAELSSIEMSRFLADFCSLEIDAMTEITVNHYEKLPNFVVKLEVDKIGTKLIESSFKDGCLYRWGWSQKFKKI